MWLNIPFGGINHRRRRSHASKFREVCRTIREQTTSIGRELRADYRKWLPFHLDFCGKFGHPATSSVPLFMAKLAEKNQSEARRRP